MKRVWKFLPVPLVLAACGDDPVPVEWNVAAMTQNVYVGADIEQILVASSVPELLAAVEQTFQEILSTDFPERAGRLASGIASAMPDVVGLQEISLLRTQSPGDAAVGGTVPATDTLQDYLTLLLDSLTALGADYGVAAKVENWDVELPRPNGDDARLTDFDVILVKNGVANSTPLMGNYTTNLNVPIVTGAFVEITRGWAAVDVTLNGVNVHVVNTHLESASPGVRLGQAVELTNMLASRTEPVLLIGDLNTDAITGTDPTYAQFINEGYQDLWIVPPSPLPQGASCCHAPLLDNTTSTLTQRIDFVMMRNVTTFTAVTGTVVGEEIPDKTASGLWPSDHAGVIVQATAQQ